ncbi:sulfite exporter TauE/SafE family protein [Gemmatimonas phototrophica]|uniref:sulfite exporter TauE/SafE family protein n=1 Tax=Gemmatimonas phototrophica TaxID=1379270 RepID=UPI00131479FA|nr:sulfite exporter TauE/SafE family protein [Gemmatimonas phototrophica]
MPRARHPRAVNAPTATQLIAIAAVSAISGAVNSIAGGGTLLTFPALLGLGVTPVAANATSTVALWPGSFASMMGYRRELEGAERWAVKLAIPSLLGGLTGAGLLMATSDEQFRAIVPWLVFGATLLFAFQARFMKWLRHYVTEVPHGPAPIEPTRGMIIAQYFVAIYGGYFGAGAGIVMLATFGLMGMTNIHRMNGLKNFNGICFNGIAAITFALKGLVNWPIALVMAIGSSVGGYMMSGLAQKVPQAWVRGAVSLIGIGSAVWLFLSR